MARSALPCQRVSDISAERRVESYEPFYPAATARVGRLQLKKQPCLPGCSYPRSACCRICRKPRRNTPKNIFTNQGIAVEKNAEQAVW